MATINNEKTFDAGPQGGPGAFSAHTLEHLNKILNYNDKTVRIFGTNEDPWFCGRDVCEILEYANYSDALFKFVDDDNKKSLKVLGISLGKERPKITHNEGQMSYINEEGLYSLIFACKLPNAKPFKAFMDQFFYDLRYKSGIIDIFAFMKDKKVSIDVNSPWFQELWYPISKKTHSLLTMRLFEWMGYVGEYFTQKQNFVKLLNRNNIPYEEIAHTDSRFLNHPVMIKEIEQTNTKNLHQKKWLVMDVRNFKKAVMRLNTKNGETVRDYYLNLEEVCFEYAEYQAAWLSEKAELQRKISDQKLEQQMALLSIKDKELEDAKSKLRSETSKLKEQLRKTLDFNQATKKVEPTEYIYIATTSQYQQTNKFKVGGCQSFELVKSRLTQYNSGESDSHNHFFVYLKKTISYKSIEHAISGMLMGFRENKSKELYFIHFDWLTKCLDAVMDGSTEVLLYVNENREKIVEDTINLQPTISPPIQLEQIKIAYIRAGDEPKEVQIAANKLDDETIESIREAIESYQSENNIVVRSKFEEHLKSTSPNVKLEKKKRDVWKAVQQIGAAMNPMWRYKY